MKAKKDSLPSANKFWHTKNYKSISQVEDKSVIFLFILEISVLISILAAFNMFYVCSVIWF